MEGVIPLQQQQQQVEQQPQQEEKAMDLSVPMPSFSGKREDFGKFIEDFKVYLNENNITDAKRQTELLVSNLGDETAKLVQNFFSPEELPDTNYDTIVKKLSENLSPADGVISARCRFNRTSQAPNEGIQSFVARLKCLAEDCQYGEHLSMWLRDRFVAGLVIEPIRQKLLKKPADLSFDDAYQIALDLETERREAMDLQVEMANEKLASTVHNQTNKNQEKHLFKRTQMNPNRRKPRMHRCIRCTSRQHYAIDCPHIKAICSYCEKKGHIDIACQAKAKNLKLISEMW